MIDDSQKKKLLKDLEKSGNVYLSCLKSNIARSTFYRWQDEDKKFKKSAKDAIRRGRENNADVAEHALMIKVKEKDMKAITYTLSHNSPYYKPKRISKVVMEHRSIKEKIAPVVTLEDVINEWEKRDLELEEQRRAEKEAKRREDWDNELPPKPDGARMMIWEVKEHKSLVDEWREKRGPYVPAPEINENDDG